MCTTKEEIGNIINFLVFSTKGPQRSPVHHNILWRQILGKYSKILARILQISRSDYWLVSLDTLLLVSRLYNVALDNIIMSTANNKEDCGVLTTRKRPLPLVSSEYINNNNENEENCDGNSSACNFGRRRKLEFYFSQEIQVYNVYYEPCL